MPEGFVIMQIGNEELDRVWFEAIAPAIEASGLRPRRVDKHNEGGLLKSEIIRFIQESTILIADLTNERPNVYLEIGYAMGIDKFKNLILAVREDHFPDSPNFQKGGPKVHFDLAGYDIIRWHPLKLPEFRTVLEKRVKYRLAILKPSMETQIPVWDDAWVENQRSRALEGLRELGRTGFMEIRAALHSPKINKTQTDLNDAARSAPIHTFGWPIALYLDNRDDARPKPTPNGIFAEIKATAHESYDYWSIRRNGDLYILASLFEDKQRPREIFFNTRIVRVTEALLYCLRLYTALGVDRSSRVSIAIRHGGLRGRTMTSASSLRDLVFNRTTEADEVEEQISLTLDELESKLVNNVKVLLEPLFVVFDFFKLSDEVYEDIVNKFVQGKVS